MSAYSSELIQSCKETQMLRFQSKVVGGFTNRGGSSKRRSMKRINLCLLCLCLMSGIVGLSYLLFDPVVRSIVLSKLTLSRTSETFYIWEDPPISPHLKVYFWNFTNPEAFFAGREKPELKEVGPYTYRQKWLKQNITWHNNGTISYRTRKIFTFTASESCTGCDDLKDNITTLNIPAISAYYQMRDAQFTGYLLTQMIHYWLKYNMWTTRSPNEFLWGHEETLFDIARHTMPNPPPFNKFGIFLTKNSTKEEDMGLYTMYTGQGDPYKLATIASVDGKQTLDRWNDTECDRVHGSDGASFNPYIQQKDTLWFFNDQLCRAMPLVFDKEVVKEGLPGYRFKPREDVFMSSKRYPENACYEHDDLVTGDGVFDVTKCQFNAPIVLSWPHFLHADPKFRQNVSGLSPDEEKHGFWFDIQPTTGTTLTAKARVQINVMVRNLPLFDDLSKVNDTVVPVIWFNEGIDELGPDIVSVLKTAAVDPGIYRQYILYFFVGLSLTVIVVLIVAVCVFCANRAARMEQKLRENLHDIMDPAAAYERAQAVQPMLDTYTDSTDSSRVTTACHSRNCSEGIKPQYVKDGKGEKLLERLPHLPVIGRSPPYNAIKVDVPDSLLDPPSVSEEGQEDTASLTSSEQEPEPQMVDEGSEGEVEGSSSEGEEEEATQVLIHQPRSRKLSAMSALSS